MRVTRGKRRKNTRAKPTSLKATPEADLAASRACVSASTSGYHLVTALGRRSPIAARVVRRHGTITAGRMPAAAVGPSDRQISRGFWPGSFMCTSTSVITARREPGQPRPPIREQLPGRRAEGKAALRLETSPVRYGSSAEGCRAISEATRLTPVHMRDAARRGRASSAGRRGRGWPCAQVMGARPSIPRHPPATPGAQRPRARRRRA